MPGWQQGFTAGLLQLRNHPDRERIKALRDIARAESGDVEQATAIVRTLLSIMQQAPPDHKVPILYVLDAILKAVGEPYIGIARDLIVEALSQAIPSLSPEDERRVVRTAKSWVQFRIFSSTTADAVIAAASENALRRQRSSGAKRPLETPAPAQLGLLQGVTTSAPKRPRTSSGPPPPGSDPSDPYHTPAAPQPSHPPPSGPAPPPHPAAQPPPSHPDFDALPLTGLVRQALTALPPLASAMHQLDFGPVTRTLATRDPDLAAHVAREVARVQQVLGGLLPDTAPPPMPDYAAYLCDTLLHHQMTAQQAAGHSAHAGPPAAAAPPPPPADGRVTPAEAATRNDVLDGWRVTAVDRAAVHALYEGRPFQCRLDGARFASPEQLAAHSKWAEDHHGAETAKGLMSRQWLLPPAQWVSCTPCMEEATEAEFVPFFEQQRRAAEAEAEAAAKARAAADAAVGQSTAVAKHTVPVDPSQTHCPLSGEPFRKQWDSQAQAWVYVGVVDINGVLYDAQAAEMEVEEGRDPALAPKVKPGNAAALPALPDPRLARARAKASDAAHAQEDQELQEVVEMDSSDGDDLFSGAESSEEGGDAATGSASDGSS